jgi:hypothetical protein
MTKKDYVLIATILACARVRGIKVETIIQDFCDLLKAKNDRFDENKFREYIEREYEIRTA